MPTLALRSLAAGKGMATKGSVERLQPSIRVRTTPVSSFGTTAESRGFSAQANTMPEAFTVSLVNGTGGALVFVIGDPEGIVEGVTQPAVAYSQPTAATGITVAALQRSFGTMPVMIGGFNYSSTSGAAQFGQLFRFATADVDGQSNIKPINMSQFSRNNANNANLLTPVFSSPFQLDNNAAFLVTVAAGQTVSLTAFIAAAGGRA